jgi:D-3-phosphoglycerate dehydrogenase / 2-oxoglutarate reductase
VTERRRVLVLDPTWELTWAEAALADVPVSVERGERAEGDDVVGLLVCPGIKVGRPELERLPRLEAVATNSTGFENLDVEALAGAGVWCSNVSGYCTQEVAEHTIALVLAQLRGIVELDRDLRTGGWYPYPVEPRRVGGSTLGVVGFGRIGRAVGERASSLGMHVLACDPMVAPEAIRAAGAEPVDLEEVLVRSDVVTLHCVVTKETRGLIDAKAIRSMRPGSVLVNCTRAALVDQDALGAALESGHLRGAAIDVFPVEPPGPDDPALGWPRTVLNAHAAWYSPEVALMPYDLAARDLAAALSGREPVYALARPRR